MTIAQDLHDACIAACEQCPQHRGFDSGEFELLNGRYTDVTKLPSKGIAAVVQYWRDPATIGGGLLWKSGYSECLDPQYNELFSTVDTIIEQALHKALL